MKKLICDVCGKEIKDNEGVVEFNECGISEYTHVSNDVYDCDYLYMIEKFMPTYYADKSEIKDE